MCLNASRTMMLQCRREYGFDDDKESSHTTQLHLLTSEKLAHLPTNNDSSDRVFSVFDRKATAAKFKAKSICNNVTLYQSPFSDIPERKMKEITKILNIREENWNNYQRELHEKKIKFF